MGRPGWNSEYQEVNLDFCSPFFRLLCCLHGMRGKERALLFFLCRTVPWLRETGSLQEDKTDAHLQSACLPSLYKFSFQWNRERKCWQEERSSRRMLQGAGLSVPGPHAGAGSCTSAHSLTQSQNSSGVWRHPMMLPICVVCEIELKPLN